MEYIGWATPVQLVALVLIVYATVQNVKLWQSSRASEANSLPPQRWMRLRYCRLCWDAGVIALLAGLAQTLWRIAWLYHDPKIVFAWWIDNDLMPMGRTLFSSCAGAALLLVGFALSTLFEWVLNKPIQPVPAPTATASQRQGKHVPRIPPDTLWYAIGVAILITLILTFGTPFYRYETAYIIALPAFLTAIGLAIAIAFRSRWLKAVVIPVVYCAVVLGIAATGKTFRDVTITRWPYLPVAASLAAILIIPLALGIISARSTRLEDPFYYSRVSRRFGLFGMVLMGFVAIWRLHDQIAYPLVISCGVADPMYRFVYFEETCICLWAGLLVMNVGFAQALFLKWYSQNRILARLESATSQSVESP